MTGKTLVLGLGNTLLGDEGVGVHAVAFLLQQPGLGDEVELMDGGTLSFTLAESIESADNLIVIDAAQLHDSPGTVRVFEGEGMDRFVGSNKKSSVHEVSLVDLLTIASLTEKLPARRALIGIQPESFDWSYSPSQKVREAIPVAGELALQLIRKWQ